MDQTARSGQAAPGAGPAHAQHSFHTMFVAPSGLHVTNFTGLVWLRTECRAGADKATYLFGLGSDAVRFYRELSDVQMEALCSELDLSLFVPRFDSHALPQALTDARGGPARRPAAEIELQNLCQLHALREACMSSSGNAVWTYRIDRKTADAYAAIGHDDVVLLCKTLSVSAFLPRYSPVDVARILDKPAGTRAVFAAAYETEITAANEAARRSLYLTH
jgi:hypothetical protein